MQLDLKVPFEMNGGIRIDDTPVHQAIREALANCLVNADYYGRGGVVIIKSRNSISLSNPGNFRIGLDAAKSGGLSDPRNGAMLKMLNLIDIGERAGSGIPIIFRVWHDQKWAEPAFTQSVEPDRTTLSLVLSTTIGDKLMTKEEKKQLIIDYITDHSTVRTSEIAQVADLKASRARDYLSELVSEGILIAEGANRNRTYRLKS